jgi:hypothetical protein
MNYTPTTLGVQSLREITFGGKGTKKKKGGIPLGYKMDSEMVVRLS